MTSPWLRAAAVSAFMVAAWSSLVALMLTLVMVSPVSLAMT